MKAFRLLLTGITLATVSQGLLAQGTATMQTCEWWLDYAFEQRQQTAMTADGVFTKQFDLASLGRGVHSIGLRFADSEGRWCAPFVKHFVIPTLPAETYAGNTMTAIEYWTDYDFDHRTRVATTDGNVALTLDASQLGRGVHSIAYRALDSQGFSTAPFVKHFVVPTLPVPTATGIAAYEYWFNHGPRTRMEVEPQALLQLEDMVIEIKDVIPNAITRDYTFHVDEGMVYVPDQVTFGIQAFDDQGCPSMAQQSDTFAYNVPVDPAFTTLQADEPKPFAMPLQGMKGFKAIASVGDSIAFSLNTDGQFDLYDAQGQRIETILTTDETSRLRTYKALATSETVYALLWNVPLPIAAMQVTYEVLLPSSVQKETIDNRLTVVTGKGIMTVSTQTEYMLTVYAANGTPVIRKLLVPGQQTYALPTGVYIVRYGDSMSKVVVQ